MNRERIKEMARVLRAEANPHNIGFKMSAFMDIVERHLWQCIRHVASGEATQADKEAFENINWCGTSACIAGHVVLHFDGVSKTMLTLGQKGIEWVPGKARRLLDLTSSQATALFLPYLYLRYITKDMAIAMLEWMAEQPDNLTGRRIEIHWDEMFKNHPVFVDNAEDVTSEQG